MLALARPACECPSIHVKTVPRFALKRCACSDRVFLFFFEMDSHTGTFRLSERFKLPGIAFFHRFM